MKAIVCFLSLLFPSIVSSAIAAEPIGERPYEMVWANRTADTHPALIDFENLDGWKVETKDAVATLTLSPEQQLWGKHVGKLVYHADGKQPRVTLRPPKPIAVPAPFDCVNFWVYGNNWAWVTDKSTPPVEIAVLLRGKGGAEVRVAMSTVRWKEWWVMHRKLTAEQLDFLKDGATLEGIQIANGRNKEHRTLYLDNLAIYKEELKPLVFEPRRKRGIEMLPGQSDGTNTGPGKLPFPTREETILPDNLTKNFKTTLTKEGDAFVFRYRGKDGELEYRYEPKTGTLGDVTARWAERGDWFQPMSDGGVFFSTTEQGKALAPEKIEPLGCERVGNTVVSRWQCRLGGRSAEVGYTFRLWQKSLVVDVKCPGGEIGEARFGKAVGVENPRLVTLPYMSYGGPRPAVLVAGASEKPLFIFGIPDYYRSNASLLWAVNTIAADGVTYNGGTRYEPKTDGKRNDCFERLFLTVSPCFEEVLPNIPNPKSPWMHVAGERLWRAHGASDRERDYETWKNIARYGMTKVVITDHETGWRDGGESFTFRTRAAPKRGGDESQAEYSRKIQALGFRYGIYNNYTDFAPVNEHWHEDMVTRLSNGDWRPAWARCYNPKPARAVEFEAKLAPIIQQKFRLSTAYCDVHTAVTPWSYVDYDARVPGASMLAATFYAYGEIMLHQKATWNGPVYSEGNHHWFYCGLTDGNYGQDQAAKLPVNPWLVDFDLRKLHPLCCNFGMGNPGMFYGREENLGKTPAERDAHLDRFLAATLAFGHTGFLVMEGGIENTVRSYFALQQVHAAYARQTAVEIRYADERGQRLDVSAAVASGAFRRSQIATRYANGLRVVVNGHPSETWRIEVPPASLPALFGLRDNAAGKDAGATLELPPNGWFARSADGKLLALSAIVDGHRADYVDSPAYFYADGRGTFTRFAKAASDGQLIAHKRRDGSLEVIPVGKCVSFGVSLGGKTATAVALDKEGKEIGPSETRFSRGLVYVMPQTNAFSYVLKSAAKPAVVLSCPRSEVVPGETVVVCGREKHEFRVPADVKPGARLWQQFDGAWIDFTVGPLVDTKLSLRNADTPVRAVTTVADRSVRVTDALQLDLTPHQAQSASAEVTLGDASQTVHLKPEQPARLAFDFKRPDREEVRELPLRIVAGDLRHEQKWWLLTEESIATVAPMPEAHETGQCFRNAAPTGLDGKSGAHVHPDSHMTCGNETKQGLFMHPPYQGGIGSAFALFAPVALPPKPAAAFRCEIGKRDGSDRGDGVVFRVAVIEPDGKETVVAEKQRAEHAWTPLEADLSRWAGRNIRIKLISDVGPANNSSGDWACWANPRIESREPVLKTTLHDRSAQLRHEAGPHPVASLTVADLRVAKRGWLYFEGIGLQRGGGYISCGFLNGVSIGELPASRGSETKGTWTPAVSIPLPAEAIAKLDRTNLFKIHNPAVDSFKVRRFWIELELADGRRCSSKVHALTYTQPAGWLHAEGIGVPDDEDIEVDIRFPANK
ncbi:MAG: hypothetical protein NTY01_19265 [Verrucomicrobia bacterium]|nr:hypothetical protein [Verrucomicrobiota bacterium]